TTALSHTSSSFTLLSHLSSLLLSSLFFFFLSIRPPPSSTLFPYTTLFRSLRAPVGAPAPSAASPAPPPACLFLPATGKLEEALRSEEHTSELQSCGHLVCHLLLEKKKKKIKHKRKHKNNNTT